jgi:hypothetical protein
MYVVDVAVIGLIIASIATVVLAVRQHPRFWMPLSFGLLAPLVLNAGLASCRAFVLLLHAVVGWDAYAFAKCSWPPDTMFRVDIDRYDAASGVVGALSFAVAYGWSRWKAKENEFAEGLWKNHWLVLACCVLCAWMSHSTLSRLHAHIPESQVFDGPYSGLDREVRRAFLCFAHSDPSYRAWAPHTLNIYLDGHPGHEAQVLQVALASPLQDVRQWVCDWLRHRPQFHARLCVVFVGSNRSEDVRAFSVEALTNIVPRTEEIRALLTSYTSDPDESIRKAATRALRPLTPEAPPDDAPRP